MATRILQLQKQPERPGFPLRLPFSYVARRRRQVIQNGLGETVEISSSHVRISPLTLPDGATTDFVISIKWPATLQDGTRLQLVVQARVEEPCETVTCLRIMKHEFRTAPKLAKVVGWGDGCQSRQAEVPAQESGSTPYLRIAAASWV